MRLPCYVTVCRFPLKFVTCVLLPFIVADEDRSATMTSHIIILKFRPLGTADVHSEKWHENLMVPDNIARANGSRCDSRAVNGGGMLENYNRPKESELTRCVSTWREIFPSGTLMFIFFFLGSLCFCLLAAFCPICANRMRVATRGRNLTYLVPCVEVSDDVYAQFQTAQYGWWCGCCCYGYPHPPEQNSRFYNRLRQQYHQSRDCAVLCCCFCYNYNFNPHNDNNNDNDNNIISFENPVYI